MVIKNFCYIFCHADENSIRLKSNKAHSPMILVANINFQQDYFSYAFCYSFLFDLMQLLIVWQCFLISKVDFLEFLELCLMQILFYSPGFPSHMETSISTAAGPAGLLKPFNVEYAEHTSHYLLLEEFPRDSLF